MMCVMLLLAKFSIAFGSFLSAPVYMSSRDVFIQSNISRYTRDGSVEFILRNVSLTPSESVIQSSHLVLDNRLGGLSLTSSQRTTDISYLQGTYLSRYANDRIYMPIGFHSRLLNDFGSVSLLKPFNSSPQSSGQLVIGVAQNFSNACIQESIMEIFMEPDILFQPDVFHAHLTLSNRTSNETILTSDTISISVAGWDKLLGIPTDLVAEIERLLVANGSVRIRERFVDCLPNILPDLNIVLEGYNAGFIALAPDDYFDFDPANQSCVPRYRANRSGDRLLYFNPLLLRGVNVRFNEQSFSLCDVL